jgi:putative ATP-dependent endonuclease of OLD family
MKLRAITVKNLRCIEDCAIKIRSFSSFIGPNNCGKSSILRAIELFLNQQSPGIEEWRRGHEMEDLVIEGQFEELEPWEKSTPGVAGIVFNDRIKLKLTLRIDQDTKKIEKKYEAFKQEEIIAGWSDSWTEVADNIKAIANDLGITTATGWKPASKKEQVRQKIRATHRELVTAGDAKWSSDSISIESALQQALPQAQLIPAVKNASDDGKPGAKTSFGGILGKIILPALQATPEFSKIVSAVQELQDKLSAEGEGQIEKIAVVTKSLSERLSSVIDAKVLLTMETPDADKFIGANTGIALDDGTRTSIELQGNGLQRSLVFALMEVLASQKAAQGVDSQGNPKPARSTIILFEEPELFLHPHIMRSLKRALQAISRKLDWQVVVTTHSPFLIDIADDPLSLVVFKRQSSLHAPAITQLQEDPFGEDEDSVRDREALRAVLDFHPTVCEAFFAKRTVLVEGDSEKAILVNQPAFNIKAGVETSKREQCTVVSCGGKWTIPPIAKLLKKFGIPFRVIHDMDKKGRTDAELAQAIPIDPYNANAKIASCTEPADIFVVEDTLEDYFWEIRPKSSGDKPFRVWKRLQELLESEVPLDDRIRRLAQFAFNW